MALIRIMALGSLNKEMMQMIGRHVEGMFGCSVETEDAAAFHGLDFAYDNKKDQYNSAIILKDLALRRNSMEEKLLAVTDVDLFIPMLTFVYGQAQLSGKVAIVSLARLKPEFYGLLPDNDVTVRRIRKEVAHELGHTFGLVHCTDKSCLMSLSTEIMQVDLKSESFCRSCWISLEESLKIVGSGNSRSPLNPGNHEQKARLRGEQGDL